MRLLDAAALECLPVAANCAMNRLRTLCGSNGYDSELGLDVLTQLRERLTRTQTVRWLDLCCGAGKAAIEAAERIHHLGLADRIEIVAIDLVPYFDAYDADLLANLQIVESSLRIWEPATEFDLITCAHGLHYVADKLDAVRRAVSWLTEDGLFVANIDPDNIRDANGASLRAQVIREFRRQGVEYTSRRHLIRRARPLTLQMPFEFIGADEQAGPNYTRQPAVNSHYRRANAD